jgi:hypothetical protein
MHDVCFPTFKLFELGDLSSRYLLGNLTVGIVKVAE